MTRRRKEEGRKKKDKREKKYELASVDVELASAGVSSFLSSTKASRGWNKHIACSWLSDLTMRDTKTYLSVCNFDKLDRTERHANCFSPVVRRPCSFYFSFFFVFTTITITSIITTVIT